MPKITYLRLSCDLGPAHSHANITLFEQETSTIFNFHEIRPLQISALTLRPRLTLLLQA